MDAKRARVTHTGSATAVRLRRDAVADMFRLAPRVPSFVHDGVSREARARANERTNDAREGAATNVSRVSVSSRERRRGRVVARRRGVKPLSARFITINQSYAVSIEF